MVQYDPATRLPEVVIEASSDPRKASDLARRFGKKLEAFTVLLIHRYNDNAHEHPVTVSLWSPLGKKLVDKQEQSWSEFIAFMRDLHDAHLEYIAARDSNIGNAA